MRGAIAGDIAGSRFERSVWSGDSFATAHCVGFDSSVSFEDSVGQQASSFELIHPQCFVTDDTIMSIAVMDWLMGNTDLRRSLRSHFRWATDPNLFGKYFRQWASRDDDSAYGSFGNGAAMRVAPVAFAADSLQAVRELARESAIVTHEVEHAIAGAEAIAAAVWLARTGEPKHQIQDYVSREFGYELEIELDRLRPNVRFTSDCRKTVPIAIAAFLQSDSHQQTIRRAISMGGDTDTVACMAGAIAGCFWSVDDDLAQQVLDALDARSQQVLTEFERRFAFDRPPI